MAEAPQKKTLRWVILYTFTGIIDVAQIIIDFTGVGVVVSEALEIITGPALIGIFMFFKIPIITKPRRIASLLGIALGDAITGGIAPFWVLDVWYIQSDVKREEALESQQKEQAEMLSNIVRQPLYKDGIRQPQATSTQGRPARQLNVGGIRRAKGK